MALWVTNLYDTPTGGWRFPGLNGYIVRTTSFPQLYPEVVKHFQANNLTPPTQQEVVDWVCNNLESMCADGNEPLIRSWTSTWSQPAGCCGK